MKIIYHFIITLLFFISLLLFLYSFDCSATIQVTNTNDPRIDKKPIWLCSKKRSKWSRITKLYNKEKRLQSMGILDKWSITHITHGVGIFLILLYLNNYKKTPTLFYIAILIEILWEIFENTPYIINKYRRSNVEIYRDYIGDSVANMVSDTLFTVIGIIMAWYLSFFSIFLLFIGFEVISYVTVGDNLVINIFTLVFG